MRSMFQALFKGVSLILFFFITVPCAVAQEAPGTAFNAFPCPKTLTLCGERMPLDDPDVFEMLDREFTVMVWDQGRVFMLLKRAARYFPFIEKALRDAGMPDDLKYLAVAESSLIPYARSTSGALGHWQFISETGQKKGLRKDQTVDERMALERSTQAKAGGEILIAYDDRKISLPLTERDRNDTCKRHYRDTALIRLCDCRGSNASDVSTFHPESDLFRFHNFSMRNCTGSIEPCLQRFPLS